MANFDWPIALNSWLFTSLAGGRPGGLPNDFLTRGSAALLIFDDVICDEQGLAAEEVFADRWLSAGLFRELRGDGILRPVDMTAPRYRSAEFDSAVDG
ncbi:MAG: hypothetical protein WBV06_08090, partial [Acidimicrobiia bacterium]